MDYDLSNSPNYVEGLLNTHLDNVLITPSIIFECLLHARDYFTGRHNTFQIVIKRFVVKFKKQNIKPFEK